MVPKAKASEILNRPQSRKIRAVRIFSSRHLAAHSPDGILAIQPQMRPSHMGLSPFEWPHFA